VYRRWSQSCLDRKDVAGSLAALKRGYDLNREDREIHRGIAFHTQEALRILTGGKPADLLAHLQALRQAFPDVKDVVGVGASHARRRVQKLADAQKYTEALAEVDRLADLLPTDELRHDAVARVFDAWAGQLRKAGKWEQAVEKYVD